MPKKVLIVDDSKIVQNMHSFILKEAGYECSTADNGFVALEMLAREPYDLIVCDVNMPRMDGYELTRRVRKTEGYENTPVIMISTEKEAADKMKGMEAGANVYIVKPAKPEELVMNAKMLLGE